MTPATLVFVTVLQRELAPPITITDDAVTPDVVHDIVIV
mgnify:CR=1 FL=1